MSEESKSGDNPTDNVKPKHYFSEFIVKDTLGNSEKALTSPKQTFTTSRELARQQTRKKPSQGNLFDMLNPKLREEVRELDIAGELLSQITDGINGGALVSKVIIALCQTLYTQSEMNGNTDRLLGFSEDMSNKTNTPIEYKRFKGAMSPSPYIMIKTRDFAKLVNGGKISGGKDVEAVKDVIKELDRKYVIMENDKGRYIKMRILTVDIEEGDTKTGAETLLIHLKPIFTHSIANNFVTIRKDTLKVLSGKQKDITMRLFWYLAEMHSYKNLPTYPTIRITKAELFSRIAVIKRYESRGRGKDREADFKEAVEKMKSLHLIHSYKEEYGAGGDIICVFHLNKAYTSEPMTADLQIENLSPTESQPPTEEGVEDVPFEEI